jgi:catechol-2,3-dioxygenase
MKRIHLHISVENLTQSIVFYNHLFGAKPTVEKADYAKWMLDNPLVNFAISQRGAKVGIDHIGIQVETEAELAELKNRIDEAEMSVVSQEGAACCYAKSDKHWVQDPSGIAWETYHTLDSSPTFNDSTPTKSDSACCAPNATLSSAHTIQFAKRDAAKANNCC